MKKLLSIIALAGLLLAMVFSTGSVMAQDEGTVGLSVSPVVHEISVDPGQVYKDSITITNISDGTVDVKIYVKDFTSADETGAPQLIEDTAGKYSLAEWVKTDAKASLDKNEELDVPYTIEVPNNASPGGHYGAFIFEVTAKDVEGSGTSAISEVTTLVLANVSGDSVVSATLKEFTTDKSVYMSKEDAMIQTRVENLGNVHIKPTGTITIKNAFGNVVETMNVNENQGNVLPGTIRKFENDFSTTGRFGWYTAELSLNYGEVGTLTGTTTFFIFPWVESIIGILIIILLIWLIVAATRKKPAQM